MTMQTDVKSAHLAGSGFFLLQSPTRVKHVSFSPSGSGAGYISLFDTAVAPTAATYGRSGTVITVASTGHGLVAGQQIGIGFAIAGGGSGTDGNYLVTSITDANTFVLTDINSGTVSPGTACQYVIAYPGISGVPVNNISNKNPQRWLAQFDVITSQTAVSNVLLPGEGMLSKNGVYAFMSNVVYASIFYG